jgi:hypothetical protein
VTYPPPLFVLSAGNQAVVQSPYVLHAFIMLPFISD